MMLANIDLARKLLKDEYRARLAALEARLFELQKACWEGGVGSVVVFEGWDAAGKGTAINALTRRLEPRGFRLHPIQAPRSHESELPWLWRFWNKLPNYGEMAIFDRSWYGRVFEDRVAGEVTGNEARQSLAEIAAFERSLTDDGYVLVKLFLHIGKEEQSRRLERLAKDPLSGWQVDAAVWRRHQRYDEHRVAADEMLERTDTEWGPWAIVEGTDRRWACVKVFEVVTRGLEDGLRRRNLALPAPHPANERVA